MVTEKLVEVSEMKKDVVDEKNTIKRLYGVGPLLVFILVNVD